MSYVGSYYIALDGKVDALVFAGGIGEKAAGLRKTVTEKASCLGFEIDTEKNGGDITEIVQDIGGATSKHRVLVCQTDEQVSGSLSSRYDILTCLQFEMARQCASGIQSR